MRIRTLFTLGITKRSSGQHFIRAPLKVFQFTLDVKVASLNVNEYLEHVLSGNKHANLSAKLF